MPIGESSDQVLAGQPTNRPRERRATRRLDLAGRTHGGLAHERNEDQFVIAELGRWRQVVSRSSSASTPTGLTAGLATAGDETMSLQGTLLVVADGIGGRGGGDVASAVALDALLDHSLLAMPWLAMRSAKGDALLRADVESFVVALATRLLTVAAERNLPRPLGTTLTVGYVQDRRLILAHIGDSRAYVLRDGALSRLTEDQKRSVVSTGGSIERALPEMSSTVLEGGDRILLCTDGLHGSLSDARIAEVLGAATSAEQAASTLIAEAIASGGRDDITVVTALG